MINRRIFFKGLFAGCLWYVMPALLPVLMVATVLPACSNTGQARSKGLSVVFYNVENLFDIEDDPAVNDNEFLPGSVKQWTDERYINKLQGLSDVLSGISGVDLPDIIGLCEVENRKVVQDLVLTGRLSKGRYGIVHHESPDSRGTDVALVYLPRKFAVTWSKALPVMLPGRSRLSTRDILYVKGNIRGGDEIHLFVSHWPSRSGGVDKTEPGRIAAAGVLKSVTDSLLQDNEAARIIVMGDFNDNPDNRSLSNVLKAVHPAMMTKRSLVNLMYPAFDAGEGSYWYQGEWNMLDQIIVSSALMDDAGWRVEGGRGHIWKSDINTYENSKGVRVPDRTYVGRRHAGGVSDHFPVYIRLIR
jgi:endonuclease/exonuclease/phosphatase family metal-dependent hydrolase